MVDPLFLRAIDAPLLRVVGPLLLSVVDALLFRVVEPIRFRAVDALLFRAVDPLFFRVVDALFFFRLLEPLLFRLRDWPDSDIAMATACFRLFTFLPEGPLLRSPSLYSCITFSTLLFCRVLAMSASHNSHLGTQPDRQLTRSGC